MSHYKNSVSWNYYFDSSAAESSPCEVRITGDQIVVSYETDDGYTVYAGSEKAPGHFILESDSPAGRATLHRLPDSLILEGYWEEGGSKGMWRIQLGEVSDELTGKILTPHHWAQMTTSFSWRSQKNDSRTKFSPFDFHSL